MTQKSNETRQGLTARSRVSGAVAAGAKVPHASDNAQQGVPGRPMLATASGRKIPRDGGIILAVGKSRDEIEALMKEDPFCKNGLADCRVIEFRVSQRADDIDSRLDAS